MLESIWLVHPDEEACAAFRTRFAGLRGARVIRARFEELDPHDAFVTAGNSYGLMTAGIDAAVVDRLGEQIMRRVQHRIMADYYGEQPVGTAFVIDSGFAAIPFLVHAPTMRVPGSIEGTEKVYAATWAALVAIGAHNAAAARKIETAAFPAFGTGFGGVPFDEAARQMAVAYRYFLEPAHRLDWETVTARHRAIVYDGANRVVR